jgi:PEP-CTERM motif-containing protein
MSRIPGVVCSLFLMVVFTPALARADPIVVTSGTITVTGIAGGPLFDLSGDNFHASNAGGDTGNFAPQLACGPCVAGQTVGVGGSFLGSSLGGGGSITVNGTTVTNPGYSGLFGIGGTSFIVPSVMTSVSITVPFTFAGTLNVCSGSCLINPVLFTVSLVGSGTATVDLNFSGLDNLGRPIFFFQKATFQFEEVPEPASMLLFGSGLALLTAKLKRRLSSAADSSA